MEVELESEMQQGGHNLSTGWGHALPPGRAPWLVGPTKLHRPQLQLHIYRLEEKKNQGESFIAFHDTEPPPSPNLSRDG